MGFTDDKLYFEIGWIYENLGQADSAIKYYQESIRRVPGERYAYIRIAEVSSRRGDDSTALDMYNRVIAAFPDYAYAYYHRGWLLAFTQNRRSDACLDFKKALELGYQEAKFQLDQICN
jgi:tetratricopeptide (TPR) repeat protein